MPSSRPTKPPGLLEQNRALLRAADEDVAQAVARLRPILNYVVSASYSSLADQAPFSDGISANLELSASLLLYDFGRSRLGTDVAKENVLTLREALIGVEQRRPAARRIGLCRSSAEYIHRRVAQQQPAADHARTAAARDRFEVGEITRTDVSLAEARLAAAQSGLAAATGDLAVSREEYRAAVGRYPDVLAPLPAPPATASSQDAATAVARQRHPDILQAQRNVTVADLSIALADAAMRPSLTGSASVGVDRDGQ